MMNGLSSPAYPAYPLPSQSMPAASRALASTAASPAVAETLMQPSGLTQRTMLEEHLIHRKKDYATLRTKDTNERVWIDEQGQLYARPQPTPADKPGPYQKIGQLWANGMFQLLNGYSGNIFNDKLLKLAPSMLFGPIGDALKAEETRLAQAGDEIPYIRQHLTSRGLDGRGVTIYALEFLERDAKTGEAEPADHLKLITSTLNDPQHGYVPGANVQMMLYQAPKDMDVTDDDTPQSLITKMQASSVKGVNNLTERIRWIGQNATGPSIVTFSVGTSPYEDALFLYNQLEGRDTETGSYKLPKLREQLYGPNNQALTVAKKIEHLTHWVLRVYESNPAIQQAFAQYNQACDQAAARGIPVNVAMGNDHTSLPLGANIPVKALFNWYAMAPSIIRVAATNNNATPGDISDDTAAVFSTRGDAGTLAPTIGTTGVRVFIDRYFAYNHTGAWSGTSVATPIAAAVQAMMLQANPKLTVAQLTALLKQSAQRNQTTVAETGAGVLDPVKAVNAAIQVAASNQ